MYAFTTFTLICKRTYNPIRLGGLQWIMRAITIHSSHDFKSLWKSVAIAFLIRLYGECGEIFILTENKCGK